ncbi:hypothetical protein RvY_03793 [Ramazzottius varieornatus]|uniref:Uncharacterized protein n=1 Tax=Ramazzottius varieornatus TaxID=947166 RepID=A0A1D1USY7_RAMVA|nr:hypothetical protein RvY_03793 [Ramazzottius varieornatus]
MIQRIRINLYTLVLSDSRGLPFDCQPVCTDSQLPLQLPQRFQEASLPPNVAMAIQDQSQLDVLTGGSFYRFTPLTTITRQSSTTTGTTTTSPTTTQDPCLTSPPTAIRSVEFR